MNYLDIINSDFFKQTYSKIEEMKKDYPVNHGFIHIRNVIKNAKRLAITFKLNKKEIDLLLIASTLHDIGYLIDRDDHAYNGGELAKIILKEWKFNDTDINVISNAIKNHGGKKQEEYQDKISMCLIIADKLDFISSRYNKDMLSTDKQKIFPHIKDTFLEYKKGIITLNIVITNNFSIDTFNSSSYYFKLINFLNLLCNKLNSKYNIKYIND